MEFRVLGPFEVRHAGELVGLGSAQQRAVLTRLVLRAPEPVSVQSLIDELWGERPPATAQHAVRVYVSAIRRMLRAAAGEEVVLRTRSSGYALEVSAERIDARRFERLLVDARNLLASEPARARGCFEEALALWRGPPLVEFGDSGSLMQETRRLEELHTLGLEGLVEARLAIGEHAETIGALTGLVATDPLRERPRRLLMLALYRAGRHAEALAAYRDACAALDEIGLQPGPELRQLEQAILRHDPALGAAPDTVDTTTGTQPATPGAVPAPADGRTRGAGASADAAAPSVLGPRRKVVTALFCDVTGSTALGEELDPEALHSVMGRYFREVRTVLERHGGTVEKFTGDAVMAVFGIPRVREDDALRAVRAAVEIRDRLPAVAEELGVELRSRTAVNTGLVLVGEGENPAIGAAVNVAARLQQAAAPGEILLGEETLRLVRDAVEVNALEPLAVKGKSAPVSAFRLMSVDPGAPGLARHLDRPLVGRQRELDLLRAAWERTVQESGCHLFTLLGAAGVGKSRLVSELLASVGDDATVLTGRCLPYGDGITFWPMIEALTPVGERAGVVLERLGSGGAAVPEELFFEVRRLLESLALDRPVIVHVDDLQWAEQMLLDLLEQIADLSRGAPILLLCSARPELLDEQLAWGGGKLNAATVLLEPLAAADCELLLDQLGDGLAPEARGRVITASQGNPLFLEEIAAIARDRAVVTVPLTITALLAARLERLASEERELLECAAIEGEVFHRAAVIALASEHAGTQLERHLAALVRKELIRPHPPSLHGDDAFRFRHLLIRDAAYDSLPKTNRATLHQRFARWLEHNARELSELDEIAGWHLEQTVRYRHELGRAVDATLACHAAEHLHAAGQRARERSDGVAARNLLERAHALALENSALRAQIGVELAEELIEAGDIARADQLLSAAEHDPDAAPRAALARFHWLISARPQDATQTIESALPKILEQLSKTGDERGLARAHMAAFFARWLPGQASSAAQEALLAADHAHKAGDEGLRSLALAWYVAALCAGPESAQTIAQKLHAIELDGPGPYLAARVALAHGQLERLAGRFSAARQLICDAIARLREIGLRMWAAASHIVLAEIDLAEGNATTALTALLSADAMLAEAGERTYQSTVQAYLARAYEQLGEHDAAQAAIALAEELGTTADVINFAVTHQVRARLALADADTDAAERWARSAVQHANGTDFITDQARTRLELAQIRAAIGHRKEAVPEARAALALYQTKGDLPGAADARALLHQLGASA